MAQAPLATNKMFTAKWTERDEAVLVDLLKRKIHEIKWEIHESDSPYTRAKLRKTRAEYKKLLDKVERGDYDANILAAELKTHSEYNTVQRQKREKALGRYADAYAGIDFDFESYFSKTRYFGAACPLVMLILTVLLLVALFLSSFLSADMINSVNDTFYYSTGMRLSLTSIAYIRLGPNEMDFEVPNDGNWPSGTYYDSSQATPQGQQWRDPVEQIYPDTVWLYADLKMSSIDITVYDVIKALFRTPMMSENRIDVIENLDEMQGPSWYYVRFIRDRADDIVIERDENGDLNGLNIVRHIATYGTIVFLVLTIVLSAIELIMNIGRLFSYTSRRLHALPIFILLCILLTAFCPAFIELDSLTAEGVQTAFTNYFSTNWDYFITAELVDASGAAVATPALTCINLLFPVLAVIPFVVALMPLVFRNRPAQTVTFVPKGNKPHTYAGHSTPTKAGQPGDKHALSNNKGGKVAMAGSRSPQTSRLPKR